MVQHLQQDGLQEAAAPARAEEAAVHHGVHHAAGAADGRQAEVRVVALGVAADVHRPLRQPGAEADQWGGGDVAGMVVLHHHDPLVPAQDGRQRGAAAPGERHARRVVGAGLQHHGAHAAGVQRVAEPRRLQPLVVHVHPDDLGPQQVQQVEEGREARMLHHDAVAEADHRAGDAVQRVHGPVDDGDGLRRERPVGAQPLLQRRQHRVVEVVVRQRAAPHGRQQRAEVRQQCRIGGAGAEVEGEVAGAFGDPAVAAGGDRPGGLADERALPPAGVDRAHGRQRLPRLADGGGGDAQPAGQVAHRGQA